MLQAAVGPVEPRTGGSTAVLTALMRVGRACGQVWSAVATGDIQAVQQAYNQGLSVSFALRQLGPHLRPQDTVSSKTPLHLVFATRAAPANRNTCHSDNLAPPLKPLCTPSRAAATWAATLPALMF